MLANPPLLSFLDPAPNRALYWIWRIIYWSAYVSIWAVYPLLSSYSTSPEFKQAKRWWRALKENLIYYGIYAAAGLGLMVWVSVSTAGMTFNGFMGSMILIGNTFGLLLVIVLLSIGVVRIPRNIWRMSRRHVMLKHYMWHLAEAHVEYEQAKRALLQTLKTVRLADRTVAGHDHNRKYLERVLRACPPEYADVVVGEGDFVASYDGMVALHARLLGAVWDQTRTRAVYLDVLTSAIRLEDVLEHARSAQVFWRSAIRWSFAPKRSYYGATVVDRLESWYYRYAEQICLKLVALFCAVLSVAVIWTEVTIFSYSFTHAKVDLSIFSLLLSSAATPFAVELLVWIPVTYITVCVFHSLFSVRVFHYYRFLPGQATNARTLLMSASYMGRLVPPLVFNYLLMIHCGQDLIRNSAYSGLMGPMQQFPILGSSDAFAVFFPMVIVLLVAVVLFNLVDRLLALCRVKQFEFDDHFDDQTISTGERILRTEREAMERSFDVTDEEEVEREISEGTAGERVQFLPLGSLDRPPAKTQLSSVAVEGSGAAAAPVRSKSVRLPRSQATLLRSLQDESELEQQPSAPQQQQQPPPQPQHSQASLMPKAAPKSRIGDEISDI